jgi:hypothetical protein
MSACGFMKEEGSMLEDFLAALNSEICASLRAMQRVSNYLFSLDLTL